jgi:ATP-dependent DNA helicase RecG
MALPINIEDLLGRNVVESNRIEYKSGWNPDSIYRTICAFANDFEDTCGGYIVVGVEENNGRPVRPVKGIDINQIDHIGKEMVGFNNQIIPYYQPRVFFEKVDGKTVMVIWVAAGERRPYKVPDRITDKSKSYSYYIRYNSSSIVAKDEYFNELMDLANKAPFDDRGNIRAKMEDISMLLIRDYLAEIRSSMVNEIETLSPRQVLEQLNLLEGPTEQIRIKNVALMMFCYKPERFFPGTQIDIVFYPEGKDGDPNNFSEAEPFRGPVHVALRKALDYLRNMVIRKNIHKQKHDEHSIVVYNYPYQAIEEALVNAYFHRSYDSYQPVEVNIQPHQIEIISYGGAERSIKLDDLRAGRRVHARRYRNARLGEFFKELHLTEGRGTGLPTIHDELQRNGSPDAIIESDDEHTYFMITIPCHPEFVCDKFTMDKDGHVLPILDDNVTENVPENPDVTVKSSNVTENVAENNDITSNVTENVAENVAELSSADKRRQEMIQIMRKEPQITTNNIANMLSVSRMTVSRDINHLISNGKLSREGGDKGGSWIVK